MLIEDGYAHSLKSLLDKDRARERSLVRRDSRPSIGRLARLTYLRAHRRLSRSPIMSDIVFPRWGVIVAALLVLFCLTVFLLSLVVIYIGDEYVDPAFSEQSVPPPRSYQ
jgi:hypothetical protein